MALSARSTSCSAPATDRPEVLSSTTSTHQAHGLIPLPARTALFGGSGLRRKKSLKPVKSTRTAKPNASNSSAVGGDQEPATTTTTSEMADSVLIESSADRKVNSTRTSRRRALVMCLALGMVRPCSSTASSNIVSGDSGRDLRRTVSEAIPRSTTSSSSSMLGTSTLMSQVSLATTVKQTNFLGEQEDLQKLFTTLQ